MIVKKVNEVFRNPTYEEIFYCLCFYNLNGQIKNNSFINVVSDICSKYAIPIKSIDWEVEGNYGRSSLDGFLNKIESGEIDIENVSGIAIYSSVLQKNAYDAYVIFSYGQESQGNDYLFVAIADMVIDWASFEDLFCQYAKKISAFVKIPYGIGFSSSVSEGGATSDFPIKSCSLGMLDEDAGNWYENYRGVKPPWVPKPGQGKESLHLHGKFRHIYRINLIGKKHIDAVIDGIRLEQWITSSDDRGKLVNIDDDTFVWITNEKNLLEIQKTMHRNRLLISVKSNRAIP